MVDLIKKRKGNIKAGRKTTNHREGLIQMLLIFLITFALYGNTLFNKYAIDDHLVAIDNPTILKGIKAIPYIFSSRYSETESNLAYGYRPIVKSSFAIEASLFGNNTFISHLINILLYAIACLVLLLILKRIFKDYHAYFPIIITILFAAHPTHTEVVASLKNRDELFSLLGSLFTMFMFLRYADELKKKYIFIGFFSFLFAYLSKPTALPYLALYPLVLFFFTSLRFKEIGLVTIGVVIIAIIARYGPNFYLPPAHRPRLFEENHIRYEELWTRITTGFYILLFYLKKLFYPYPLLFYYGYNTIPIVGFGNIQVIISILLHLSMFVFALFKIKDKNIFSFIILFYLISIVMYSNVVKPVMGIVGERFLLTPSIAFSIALAYTIFIVFRINRGVANVRKQSIVKVIAVTIIILIPYAAITLTRNNNWKDHLTLYSADIKFLKNSAKANIIYAKEIENKLNSEDYELNEKGKLTQLCIKHYLQSIKIYPESHLAWNNLGSVYINLEGNHKKAIECIKKAIEIEPENIKYHINLAKVYNLAKDSENAIMSYKKCIEFDSTDINSRYSLAKLYLRKGDFIEALQLNNEITQIDSSSSFPYIIQGNIAMMKFDTLSAIANWENAIRKNPIDYERCMNLSVYYKQQNNISKSQYYYNLAQRARNSNFNAQ